MRERQPGLFRGRHFRSEVIVLCVRWYLRYRAIDSAGDTIDFLLSPNRDLIAAKGFLRAALKAGHRPRVINVDGHPAYASAISELIWSDLVKPPRSPGE